MNTHASENSLVLLDEIGRGTSTFDGLSLAWATATYLANTIRAFSLFATHYFEMTQLPEHLPQCTNVHLKAVEHGDHIVFLHTVKAGAASKSYGLQVAKLAGIPQAVILLAKQKLHELESHLLPEQQSEINQQNQAQPKTLHPILEKLTHLKPDQLSARDALQILYELHAMLEDDEVTLVS